MYNINWGHQKMLILGFVCLQASKTVAQLDTSNHLVLIATHKCPDLNSKKLGKKSKKFRNSFILKT